jgi:hypothetical protein
VIVAAGAGDKVGPVLLALTVLIDAECMLKNVEERVSHGNFFQHSGLRMGVSKGVFRHRADMLQER